MSEQAMRVSVNEHAVNALLEDFKARWQELLNFESEVSRWFTLYVTAVIAVIGWVMGNTNFTAVQPLFKGHDGLNTVLVLVLALLNAVYVLALAFNGYRIQQIGQYLYSHVGSRLTKLTDEPFNVWEDWRRFLVSQPGAYGPERIRKVYFLAVGAVPVLVSLLIIGIYWWFEGSTQSWRSGHNLFAYSVLLTTCANGYVAYSTTAQNAQWQLLIAARLSQEKEWGITRAPHALDAARSATSSAGPAKIASAGEEIPPFPS
jgi:hypothetical protein